MAAKISPVTGLSADADFGHTGGGKIESCRFAGELAAIRSSHCSRVPSVNGLDCGADSAKTPAEQYKLHNVCVHEGQREGRAWASVLVWPIASGEWPSTELGISIDFGPNHGVMEQRGED